MKENLSKHKFSSNINAIWIKLVYIMVNDTCPPYYWYFRCPVTGDSTSARPPRVGDYQWPSLDCRACPPHVRQNL